MELVSMVKDTLQNVAEHIASYRIGQTALRYMDRTLWVVEKCARWAVPPPLDQDERPQPELIRPLPWVFFLGMLITLRVMRESISLVNLVMGKPPLRSSDVVVYIQSKRRYLRTLKYQGNRIMRARTSNVQPRDSWYSSLRSVFEFTMCFRRTSYNYGNNNTTSVSNNDEVLVVKRSKRGREDASPVASSSVESTMERLIEKMMVDLNDSDEDSNYTLTNVTSPRSEKSEITIESDQDTVVTNGSPTIKPNSEIPQITNDVASCTRTENTITPTQENTNSEPLKENEIEQKKENEIKIEVVEEKDSVETAPLTPKQESINFIQNERSPQRVQRPSKYEKIANGRTIKSVTSKKKGSQLERREIEMNASRTPSDNKSF